MQKSSLTRVSFIRETLSGDLVSVYDRELSKAVAYTSDIKMALPYFISEECDYNALADDLRNLGETHEEVGGYISMCIEEGSIEVACSLLDNVRCIFTRFVKDMENYSVCETDHPYERMYYFLDKVQGGYKITRSILKSVLDHMPF